MEEPRARDMDFGNYRPCVGIMLLNRQGLVFVGRRRGKRNTSEPHKAHPDYENHEWQMPQGGIDAGEDPYHAALRELLEETNVSTISPLAETSEWFSYDLPPDILRKSWKGRFQGQRQKWFALRFDGDESEININEPAGGQKPEFDAWRWEHMERLPELIVPFKRAVYENVVQSFKHLIRDPA